MAIVSHLTKHQRRRRQQRIAIEKMARAKELVAWCDVNNITIGWERKDGEEFTTFTPFNIDPRVIEEVTVLSKEVKFIYEQQNRR